MLISNNSKLLLMPQRVPHALEEGLELFQRRVEGDDGVPPALALEAHHGAREGVLGFHGARVELRLQRGDRDVAEQRPRL